MIFKNLIKFIPNTNMINLIYPSLFYTYNLKNLWFIANSWCQTSIAWPHDLTTIDFRLLSVQSTQKRRNKNEWLTLRENREKVKLTPTAFFINITYTKKTLNRQNQWCKKGRVVPCLGVFIRQYCR